MPHTFLRHLLISILLMLFVVPLVYAERQLEGFDSKQDYDIYFYSGENNTAVLENVNIVGFKQIAGKEFLVIVSKGFKLTEEAGYIDFDSVIAILPDRHFRVRKTDGIRIRESH